MSAPGSGKVALAMAALVVLLLVSAALPFAAWPQAPQGLVLAAFKVVVLAYLVLRVRARDVYAMQWSSMLILLFFAEAIVRATTDPAPSSWIAVVATLASVAYFAAVLAVLRPLKKAAKAARA